MVRPLSLVLRSSLTSPCVAEELAFAAFDVVVVSAQLVLGDVHAFHPQFPVVEVAIGVDKAGFTCADRLDFRSREHDSGGIFFQEFIIEGGSFVFYIDIVLHTLNIKSDGGNPENDHQ